MTWGVPVDRLGAFVDGPRTIVAGAHATGGPLTGVRLAVKDVFDVAGCITGAGNPTFAERRGVATTTSSCVSALVDAGATVVGRTVTDELAYSLDGTNVHLGTPYNSAWPGHVTGGSSSGSAAAVAGGLADLGLGTDTGGSIRVPASYCRLYGWRPTHGALPADSMVPLAPSFDTPGLLARDPDLLLAAAEVFVAPTGTLVTRLVAATDDALAAAQQFASALGVSCERADVLPCPPEQAAQAFRYLQGREAWTIHGPAIRAGLRLGPGVAARFAAAATVTDDQVAEAQEIRDAVRDALDAITADGTVVAWPAAAGPPRALDDRTTKEAIRMHTLALTAPAGLAGLPVVVTPTRPAGQPPLGLAVMGARNRDLALLTALHDVSKGGPRP
ncbi:MAG: amidase family protein [Acidimicrobiia bacterium]